MGGGKSQKNFWRLTVRSGVDAADQHRDGVGVPGLFAQQGILQKHVDVDFLRFLVALFSLSSQSCLHQRSQLSRNCLRKKWWN